jgi:hypothetical protein
MYRTYERTLKLILTFMLLVAVTALIVIGLVDFDLFVWITSKIIVAIVIVGVPVLVLRKLFGLS